MDKYDYIVVGAGLSGCVIARKLSDCGKKVLILERRTHIGGNLYDYENEGVLVQKYGPHIFHTNNDDVITFIKQYATWDSYKLQCKVLIDGKFTPSPFNFETIDQFYDESKAILLKSKLINKFPQGQATILELLDDDDETIRNYGNFLYEKDYSLYTSKQWGIKPEEVDKSVLRRVPVIFSYKNAYFNDKFEALPQFGYTKFIEKMINTPNITIQLGVNALDDIQILNNEIIYGNSSCKIIFTGRIDELFNYEFGVLPYRSLRFETEVINATSFQEVPVVAYPSHEYDYTRIAEYTKLPYQISDHTVIVKEYPINFISSSKNEPYYPILTEDSKTLYNKYLEKSKTFSNLYLLGRLAEFKYYNMDQCINNALVLADFLSKK